MLDTTSSFQTGGFFGAIEEVVVHNNNTFAIGFASNDYFTGTVNFLLWINKKRHILINSDDATVRLTRADEGVLNENLIAVGVDGIVYIVNNEYDISGYAKPILWKVTMSGSEANIQRIDLINKLEKLLAFG